jgi:hypothetical protein
VHPVSVVAVLPVYVMVSAPTYTVPDVGRELVSETVSVLTLVVCVVVAYVARRERDEKRLSSAPPSSMRTTRSDPPTMRRRSTSRLLSPISIVWMHLRRVRVDVSNVDGTSTKPSWKTSEIPSIVK